jgi:pimeloyl-ACP methyl ester carboxylesterase
MVLRSYEMQRDAWEDAVEEVVLDPPVNERLGEIECPTLVIIGAEDVADMQAIASHVAASIAGAQLVRVPRAAHLPSLERAEEVSSVLLGFLRGA